MTQCGLPMVAALKVNSWSWMRIFSPRTSRGAPATGILAESKLTRPISIVSSLPPSLTTVFTWPPGVSTVKVGFLTRPWSQRKREKMRRPLPDFSASEPSGLKMRRPNWLCCDGSGPQRMPSEPTPKLRWHTTRICSTVGAGDHAGKSAGLRTM